MKKFRTNFKTAVAILFFSMLLTACGKDVASGQTENTNNENESIELNIAYQYGLAYAPLMIVQEHGLIEKEYKQATGKDISVVWNQMSSGADINTGIASGGIQAGFMGIAPAITGIMNNVGYKIFTNLSGQEHGLITNDQSITSLGDLVDSEYQIGLVNIGSIQHIILARALVEEGYDAHILDSNLVAMKHPDGMTSLKSGNIACHLTTNPYIYIEREDSALYEISGISDVWSAEDSFIVGVASVELYNDNPELYQALCEAVNEAIAYINENLEEAAKVTYKYDANSIEDEMKYLQAGTYSTKTSGIFEIAKFMADAQFIEQAPKSYSDLVYDNVQGD